MFCSLLFGVKREKREKREGEEKKSLSTSASIGGIIIMISSIIIDIVRRV
jgi:hypothetical protein